MAIVFYDEQIRQFSMVDNTEFSEKPKFDPKTHMLISGPGKPAQRSYKDKATDRYKLGKSLYGNRGHVAAAGGVAGAGVGAGTAYLMAKKAAKEAGLEPGTPEYKSFVRKRVLAGAGAGAALGAGAGYAGARFGGNAIKKSGSKMLDQRFNGPKEDQKVAKQKTKDRAALKKEMEKGWNKLPFGIHDRESAQAFIDNPNTAPDQKKEIRMKMRKLNLHFSNPFTR